MKRIATRWYKTHKIGQAHLAPGMTLQRYQTIMTSYPCKYLSDLSDHDLDEIIRRISAVVKNYQSEQ